MKIFSNLNISSVDPIYNQASGFVMDRLDASLRRVLYGEKKSDVRFYTYANNSNKTIGLVLVNSALQQVASMAINSAQNIAKNYVKSLFHKNQQKVKAVKTEKQKRIIEKGELQNQKESARNIAKYGTIKVNGADNKLHVVPCLDFYGNFCMDGLMMKAPSKEAVTYSINNSLNNTDLFFNSTKDTFSANFVIFSDPTAIISVNSTKNLILTKVSGRDYSRKELVSNGDIEFSVSGHIMSPMADVYPEDDVQKLKHILQYKGIIEINNIILDQFDIDKIVIKDWSFPSQEGSKSVQSYSFNAVGLQPRKETTVSDDTLYIDSLVSQTKPTESESAWAKFLKDRAEGASYEILDIMGGAATSMYGNATN